MLHRRPLASLTALAFTLSVGIGACRTDATAEIVAKDIPTCGNGVLEHGEECDDGNGIDKDLCRNTCVMPTCGDGLRSDHEPCDWSTHPNCRMDCSGWIVTKLTCCGNGVVNPGEDCDPGTGVSTATCDEDCTDVECGDGILNAAAGECCEPNETEDCLVDGVVDCTKGCGTSGAGGAGGAGGSGGAGESGGAGGA